ncbi:helix-turn-helix domain-containing protein [Agromyces sp. SYSU T00194]|uniref:helix-turn-helix domain-containing protein n=1 Tax=Agromyces chitinivorans TaxID=3158560 RepID=UPI003392DA26
MSMHLATDPRFEFDLADRIRRALRVSGVGVGEMADELEVSRNTVSNWINGRNAPRRRDLRVIAMRTGMPLEWLENGEAPRPEDPDGGLEESRLWESNPRPIHYE